MLDQKIKIVLAEDEEFLMRTFKNRLEIEDFEVIGATNGVEALEKIRSENPDLVLLDILMPEKNGFEVLKEVAADASLSHIPIIVSSNLGQDSDLQQAKELGAVDYIVKSDLSLKDMVAKIKMHLS